MDDVVAKMDDVKWMLKISDNAPDTIEESIPHQ